MAAHTFATESLFAQAPPPQTSNASPGFDIWMIAALFFLTSTIGIGLILQSQVKQLQKKLRTEEFKNRELQTKFKRAVDTITKMEKNPDLIHSREFNLDYLRMRMEEETFHFGVVNQIKVKVKSKISVALRPTPENRGSGRQVDETFDVQYETGAGGQVKKRVLFRIQIKLTKLPTQPTSATISQIIDCIETYLSPAADQDTWQPALQGRVAFIHWDQNAKPTPLLVLEQTNEGVNVTFRTNRSSSGSPPQTKAPEPGRAPRRLSNTGGTPTRSSSRPGAQRTSRPRR
jgi:hypothetical protein